MSSNIGLVWSLFTRDESIGGLEISDSCLRLTVLETVKDKKEKKFKIGVKILVEETLPENCIVDGKVADLAVLTDSLKKLVAKAGSKIKYLIISIPGDNVYLKVSNFPTTLKDKKLEEAMEMVTNFQLPRPSEETFFGWQEVDKKNGEYLLAMAPRDIIGQFIKAIEDANLKIVAIEFHPISFLRSAEISLKENVMVKSVGIAGSTISIISGDTLHFVRALPKAFSTEKLVDQEVKKISIFSEAENLKIDKVLSLKDLQMKKSISDDLVLGSKEMPDSNWLISIGAALRGLLPRASDKFVSLMPITTEDAYEYQKASVFSGFVANLTVGLSMFFVVVFLFAWGLMNYIHQSSLTTDLTGLESSNNGAGSALLESKTKQLNALIDTGIEVLKKSPKWSMVLEEIKSKVASGILITSANFSSPQYPINLTGVADNRSLLNSFKKSLEESTMFTDIVIPLTNLEMSKNISFSVSLKIKNPQILYNQ